MKTKALFLVLIGILLINCDNESTDDLPEMPEETNGTVPSQIVFTDSDGAWIRDFTYDNNRLLSIQDNIGYKTNYTYNEDQLVRIDNYEDGILAEYGTLEYDGNGRLSEFIQYFQEFGDELDGSAFKMIYNYNGVNSITVDTYTGDFDSQEEFLYSEIYFFENNQLIEIDLHDFSGTRDHFLTLSHDNMTGVFSNIENIEVIELVSDQFELGFVLEGSVNNLVEKFDKEEIDYVTTYNYDYNQNGYPVSAQYEYFATHPSDTNNNTPDQTATIDYKY